MIGLSFLGKLTSLLSVRNLFIYDHNQLKDNRTAHHLGGSATVRWNSLNGAQEVMKLLIAGSRQ